jgi:hypothetical protein
MVPIIFHIINYVLNVATKNSSTLPLVLTIFRQALYFLVDLLHLFILFSQLFIRLPQLINVFKRLRVFF